MTTSSAMAAAFDLLQEEVDAEIARVNQEGSAAMAAGDYDRADAAMGRGRQLKGLQGKLDELANSYSAFFNRAPTSPGGKLQRGLKTPQEVYRLPILQTLVKLGGRGGVDAVLDGVYSIVKDRLNEYDLASLPSDEDQIRWRNTAQWARNSMRAEGLLKADSPRGIWEISDAGRRAVEEAAKPRK